MLVTSSHRLSSQARRCLHTLCLLGPLLLLLCAAAEGAKLLTTARAVHQLSTDEASKGYQVHLRGVVTAGTGWRGSFFLEDPTGGLFIQGREAGKARAGDEIELTGVTAPGQYAPVVIADRVSVAGQGKLPQASYPSYQDLISGEEDSRWVEVRGVVHSAVVTRSWGRAILLLNIDLGPGTISARILHFDSSYPQLVDASVRVRGVCGAVFNDKRQLVGLRLYVSDISSLEVEQAAGDPFAAPLTAISKLQQFGAGHLLEHRVRVRGRLIYQSSGQAVYLQSGSDGIEVKTDSALQLKPGAVVEAAGFIAPGHYVPELRDAVIRQVGDGPPVTPVHMAASKAIQASNGAIFAPFHGVLVETEGEVIDAIQHSREEILLLRDHDTFFQARMGMRPGQGALSGISQGTRVRVRAVCLTESDENQEPRAFYLLVRSPADVVVLHATWWATQSFLWTLAGLVLAAFGLTIWNLQRSRSPIQPSVLQTDAQVQAVFRALSGPLGLLAAAIGATVVAGGWIGGVAVLRSFVAGYAAMKPAAAFAAVLLGAALTIESGRGSVRLKRVTLAATLALMVVLATPTILHPVLAGGAWSGILARLDQIANGSLAAGPMAFTTVLVLIAVSLGLLSLHLRRCRLAAQGGVLAAAIFCSFNVLSYSYGVEGGGGMALESGMAMPTGIALLLLCVGVLFSHAESGAIQAITTAAPGGVMARRLLPPAVLIPAVLGWLCWQGQLRAYYANIFGFTLFAAATIALFSLLIWTSARLLNTMDVERTISERRLGESEANFRQLAETLPQAVWFTQPDGRVEYFNGRWYEYTGQTREEALDWGWQPVLHPDDLASCLSEWVRSLGSGEPLTVEYRLRRAVDGAYRWHVARALPLRDSAGRIVRWFGTVTDIHTYKEAEAQIRAFNQQLESRVQERTWQVTAANEELARTQTRLETVLASATQVAIIALDESGIIQLFNPGAEAMLQYEAAEVVGRHTPLLFQPPEESEERARLAAERTGRQVGREELYATWAFPDEAYSREGEYVRRDGSRLQVSIAVNPIIGADGERLGTLGMAVDISRRKELESRLQASNLELQRAIRRAEEASRAKSDFLSTMSHEIRTPLNAIAGMAELLGETALAAKEKKYVSILQQASSTLLGLINDLLDLSKIEAGHLELERAEFDLEEAVERAAGLMRVRAEEKGLTLRTEIAPDVPPRLLGDRTRLGQILLNLLGNAVKFTEEGEIALSVGVQSIADTARLRFDVSDTGIGIPADRLEAVFEDFAQADSSTTRRFGGTGLGLAICRRLVRLMDGELVVTSEPGKGSTFSFEAVFGLCGSEEQSAEEIIGAPASGIAALAKALDVPQHSLKILVADDSEDNRFLVEAYVGGLPYALTFAEDGEKAFEAYLAEKFDLILMDMQMPVMDGLTATRRIRAFEAEHGRTRTPVVALTANAMAEDLERTREAGFDSHLSKPISKRQLLDAVRTWGDINRTVVDESSRGRLSARANSELQ